MQRLKQLSALLAARKFRAFWSLVSAPPTEGEDKVREVNALVEGLKESAQGWAERVRKEIAGEVERCFRSLKREQLAAFLGTDGASPLLSLSSLSSPPCPARSRPAELTRAPSPADVDATIQAQGWKLDGAEVRIPPNESNAPKAQVTHERIEIERASSFLSFASRSAGPALEHGRGSSRLMIVVLTFYISCPQSSPASSAAVRREPRMRARSSSCDRRCTASSHSCNTPLNHLSDLVRA